MAGPRLVLLDEPAGGVNPTMLAGLRERLREINATQRATFVVIEHNMEFVMSLCTRVLVLAEGRIIAEGTPDGDPRQSRRDRGLPWRIVILVLEDVVAGYGGLTVLNGTSLQAARGAITTIIGPERRGQVHRVQDRVRAAAGARRAHRVRGARDHELQPAPAARAGHFLRAAGAQHLSRAERAPQPRARRDRGARPASTSRRASSR